MKIVDVSAFYAPAGGGVKTYVDRKLATAAQFGHDLTVIAPGEADRIEPRGPAARIRWLAAPSFPLDRRYRYFVDERALHAALDAEAPDFVEASSPWRSARFVADWRGSAPRALIMHADPLSAYAYRWFGAVATHATIDRYFNRYWRHLLGLDRRFDLVVSASNSLSRRLKSGGLGRVTTIPMGVDPGRFSPGLRDAALRERMVAACGLSKQGLLLLGLGRLAAEKRWGLVIEAAMAVGVEREVGLFLVGDGSERQRLERLVGENPHIRLAGAVRDRALLARMLASADALVHGCEAETFCIAAAEAKASGLPLIVPDEGGASDLADGVNDLTYRSGSARSAAQAIRRFRRLDSPTVAKARSMDDHFEDLFSAYSRVLEQRRAA